MPYIDGETLRDRIGREGQLGVEEAVRIARDAADDGVEMSGPIVPTLYVSSDATDTDFTVKVIDVYPDGRAYNLDESIQRMRYRNGYDQPPVWMEEGEVYEVMLRPLTTSNYVAPGHRLRIEVSSSNSRSITPASILRGSP